MDAETRGCGFELLPTEGSGRLQGCGGSQQRTRLVEARLQEERGEEQGARAARAAVQRPAQRSFRRRPLAQIEVQTSEALPVLRVFRLLRRVAQRLERPANVVRGRSEERRVGKEGRSRV